MSNLHRLNWIDAQIRAAKYPNCRSIAAQFEISPRQAARDIEYLRDTMGAPLTYSAKCRGFYYTEPTFALPGLFLSEQEGRTLSDLARQYENAGSAQAVEIAALFQRLSLGRAAAVAAATPPTLSGDSLANMPARVREPYRAMIQFEGPLGPAGLNMPYRMVAEGRYEITFYESADLLAALLALPHAFRILTPQWLRRGLLEKLEQIRLLNG